MNSLFNSSRLAEHGSGFVDEPRTENGLLFCLEDNSTHNVVAWIPGRNNYTIKNPLQVILDYMTS